MSRLRTTKKQHGKNFYVLDTETSGFKSHGGTDEPIQIVILLYLDGKESARHRYREYFLPKGDMTTSAFKTHGLTKDALEEKGAKEITRSDMERINNFLHEEVGLPIVAHCARYDRD